MTIKETVLTYNIQTNVAVRSRIEAIVRDKLWAGTGDPTVSLPIEDLAWAVSASEPVRKAVRDALDPEQPNVARGCDAIEDTQLIPAVAAAMKRLKIGGS